MIDKNNSTEPAYIFNLLAIILLIISTLLYFKFEDAKDTIYNVNKKADLKYVQSLANNLSNDISRVIENNFIESIKYDLIIKEYIESDLKLFVTTKYKYIYILEKDNQENLSIIADSSKNIKEKNELLKIYKKFSKKNFLSVYKSKKSIYLETDFIGATYIKPIIQNNKVKALIIINFTLSQQETIKSELEELKNIFNISMIFFVLVFIAILWFSYTDTIREDEKNMAYIKLQETNKMLLFERGKLDELNNSLENKIKDAIEKNRQQDQLIMQQARLAQMGEMISMIAHQWRQPLSAISSTSTAINLKATLGKLDHKIAIELTNKILEYTQHLSTTIDDFREFFKTNKEKRLTSYEELINNALTIIGTSIVNKNIVLEKELLSDVKFHTYPNEIKQVILNLIKNAEDVLLEREIQNPKIKIKSENGVLTVSDNAGGIPNDIVNKIFDPYFSTKTKKDGTGLGLYISKTIIEEHCHGQLIAYNDKDGAVFKITLKSENG